MIEGTYYGIIANSFSDFARRVYDHIFDPIIPDTSMNAILITGYEPIVLKGELSAINDIDTDVDGLTDWDEVDVEHWVDAGLITYNDDNTIKLPTVEQCMKHVEKSYVAEALDRLQQDYGANFGVAIGSKPVMPISSDPTIKDTDGDGYGDEQDLARMTPFVNPVMLIHGRIDNTYNAFGLSTPVCPVDANGDVISHNNHFNTEKKDESNDENTEKNINYADVDTHIIDDSIIKHNTLGYALVNDGYVPNKNLFAFNYPNQDFAEPNCAKLKAYIENIEFAVSNEVAVNIDDFLAKPSDIYATKQDMSDGRARFILIGHSNGGLVSRYYIENEDGDENVDKLITIDTPHYGANVMMLSFLSAYSVIYGLDETIVDGFDESLMVPLDVELRPYSSLYTGEKLDCLKVIEDTVTNIKPILNGSYGAAQLWVGIVAMPIYVTSNRMLDKYEEWRNNNPTVEYINNNQSERLNGNSNVSTKYYAVGGMNINIDGKYKKQFGNQQLVIEFEPNYDSKEHFETSLSNAEMAKYGVRYTDINSDDNIVEIFSQLGVYLSEDTIISYIDFERMTILTSDDSKNTTWNHYHSKILAEVNLHNVVIDYIND